MLCALIIDGKEGTGLLKQRACFEKLLSLLLLLSDSVLLVCSMVIYAGEPYALQQHSAPALSARQSRHASLCLCSIKLCPIPQQGNTCILQHEGLWIAELCRLISCTRSRCECTDCMLAGRCARTYCKAPAALQLHILPDSLKDAMLAPELRDPTHYLQSACNRACVSADCPQMQ